MNLYPKFADFCSLLSKYFACVFDTLFELQLVVPSEKLMAVFLKVPANGKGFSHLQGSSNFLLGFQPLVLGSMGDVHQPNRSHVYTPIVRIPYQGDNHPQYKEFLGSQQQSNPREQGQPVGRTSLGRLYCVFAAWYAWYASWKSSDWSSWPLDGKKNWKTVTCFEVGNQTLGCGFKDFLFSPLFWEDSHFD